MQVHIYDIPQMDLLLINRLFLATVETSSEKFDTISFCLNLLEVFSCTRVYMNVPSDL